MGFNDFFRKGPCPHCQGEVDVSPQYGRGGSIQSKIFLDFYEDSRSCFNDYYPGSQIPMSLGGYHMIYVGKTACCNKTILGHIRLSTLVQYVREEDVVWIKKHYNRTLTVVNEINTLINKNIILTPSMMPRKEKNYNQIWCRNCRKFEYIEQDQLCWKCFDEIRNSYISDEEEDENPNVKSGSDEADSDVSEDSEENKDSDSEESHSTYEDLLQEQEEDDEKMVECLGRYIAECTIRKNRTDDCEYVDQMCQRYMKEGTCKYQNEAPANHHFFDIDQSIRNIPSGGLATGNYNWSITASNRAMYSMSVIKQLLDAEWGSSKIVIDNWKFSKFRNSEDKNTYTVTITISSDETSFSSKSLERAYSKSLQFSLRKK